MTAPTQGEVRTWARSQAMTVNARGSLPAETVEAYLAAHGAAETSTAAQSTPQPESQSTATSPALPDLAEGMRRLITSIDLEVDAVSALSDSIDGLVGQLNAARQEQAARLTVLDELQAAVDDPSLGAFLQKAIRPRKTRVAEVLPDRLR